MASAPQRSGVAESNSSRRVPGSPPAYSVGPWPAIRGWMSRRYSSIRSRRGQDVFRKGLMDYWQGCCAITGLDIPELLRASHAKPWKDATDAERLDVHNGLLLTAHLDAAFDRGLISIDDDGKVIQSPRLSKLGATILGVNASSAVRSLAPAHMSYLAWHRANVFLSE